jgi:hypothetical protein
MYGYLTRGGVPQGQVTSWLNSGGGQALRKRWALKTAYIIA